MSLSGSEYIVEEGNEEVVITISRTGGLLEDITGSFVAREIETGNNAIGRHIITEADDLAEIIIGIAVATVLLIVAIVIVATILLITIKKKQKGRNLPSEPTYDYPQLNTINVPGTSLQRQLMELKGNVAYLRSGP